MIRSSKSVSPDRRTSTGSVLTDIISADIETEISSPLIRFAGYAAIFNRIDRGGDIIRPGAFGALAEGQSLPLLWQHRSENRIGSITYAREDERGLRVIGTVSIATGAGRQAAAMLSGEAVKGLSFGYRVKQAMGHRPRVLHALDVAEISLVAAPMQPLARVHLWQGDPIAQKMDQRSAGS